MKTWILAPRSFPCGGCRVGIKAGDPMLEIRNDAGVRLARCRACAKTSHGTEPPAEIRELVAPQPSIGVERLPRVPLFAGRRSRRAMPDVRARQLPREPGEDDA